ncbi:hypothetical protein ATO12_20330 [Aquimarina atlantica]|uniref:Peptidase M1 membrane alanine aminopeptidase domain-containing protein n=1 Tax=Aquimarina atlantica TaxID=1317122 RepID=A0A023BTP0_9FLAO|nr:hypothetical protein [Aquimarina atlantica]EZH73350.1 hypothetical protein ATO12_20330 [Aquimarina atlantica]
MKTHVAVVVMVLFWVVSYGQKPIISINATIDKNLNLNGILNLEIPHISDTLKIYKLSAGMTPTGMATIKINTISSQGEKLHYNENDQWISIPNVHRIKNVAIQYELDLKAIYDWRKEFGYTVFSGGKERCWYPNIYINNKHDFHKDFNVVIEHPKRLTLLTSGTLITEEVKQATSVSYFKAKNVLDYGLNAGWDYVNKTISNGEVSLSYFCPKAKKEIYRNIANTAMEAINWYTEKYGFFPKKRMGLAIGHPKWRGGFPSENLFYIHQGNIEKSFIQWITSHELGHYYWGLHVLSTTDLSPLMLANGIWIDHLYLSEVYNKSFNELWNLYSPQAAMIEKYLATCLANYEQEIGFADAEQNFGFDYNSNVAHAKAAVGIYLISNLIGEQQYLELQKELLKHFEGKPLSIQDYILFLEDRGHSFVRKFITQWYQDHAMIEYDFYKIKTKQNDQNWEYSFEIRKKGTVDYPIEITVVDEKGNVYQHLTKAQSNKEAIKGNSKFKPIDFKLDVNGKIPMWNSDNTAIQRAFIFALYRAGKSKIATQLAESYLKKHTNDIRLQKRLKRHLTIMMKN